MEDPNLSCPTKNCNLKFENELNLKSHTKRHDMVLTLNKTNISTTDQTPTPTRFIRNCEEIGLFQDLQNVNPFEETFRKAAENAKKGVVIRTEMPLYLSKPAGDDLHTPHLFPDVQETMLEVSDHEVVVRSEADTSLKTISPLPSPQHGEGPKHGEPADDPVQVILKLPSGGYIQLSTKPIQTIPISNVSILPSIKPTNSSVILNQNNEIQTKPAQQPDIKTKLKAFLGGSAKVPANFSDIEKRNSRKRSQSPKSNSEDGESSKERRQKVLERNRKAAYRCRAKRKKWVEELVKRAEQMSTANKALVHEVVNLKDEVARLKGLLLAHSNCPVTLAANRLSFTVVSVPVKEKLRLNLDKGIHNEIMDLDSPSLVVKKDEVLSSAAPPTPDEKIVTFPELDRDTDITEVSLDDKLTSSIGTTVIQINPNVLKTHAFS